MGKGFFQVPIAVNDTVKSYAPGSTEREAVTNQYTSYYNGSVDVPLQFNIKKSIEQSKKVKPQNVFDGYKKNNKK